MEYKLLTTAAEIDCFTSVLKENKRTTIALDFEGEFNLHAYGERLCLIQIYDGSNAFIIDPMVADMDAVKRLFEDEKILKIMWDAQSDLSLIVNGYSMTIKSVFDLRPSANLLELPKKDYASVASEILGIEKKSGKSTFQKYNWMRRPIDKDAVEYALDDVLHLHNLRDAIIPKLLEKNLLNEYLRQVMIIQNRSYVRVPGQRHKKMKGYRYMESSEKELLKTIFNLRDGFARKLDWPPHRVIPNPDLLDIAKGAKSPNNIRFDRKLKESVKQEIITDLKKAI